MLVLNFIVVGLLALSIMALYISPERLWFMSIMGFGFFGLYIMNLLFMIYWMIMRRRFFLLSLLFFLIGMRNASGIIQFNFRSDTNPDDEKRFKVMSYNVRLFDLYNWTHNKQTRAKMLELLQAESPDILCLQEYYNSDNGDFKNTKMLLDNLRSKNYHIEITETLRKTDHWGIATFTVYPVIKRGRLEFGHKTNNIAIFTDMVIGVDTVRVFNVHLQSIHFMPEDYDLIQKFGTKNEDEQVEGSRKILLRLKNAAVKRAAQAELLQSHIKQSPYPVIVCGDFNDTPISYVYKVLANGMKDAFRQSGMGFGQSYAGVFPSFRIDYILHSKNIRTTDYTTIRQPYSDHYPISCFARVEESVLPTQ